MSVAPAARSLTAIFLTVVLIARKASVSRSGPGGGGGGVLCLTLRGGDLERKAVASAPMVGLNTGLPGIRNEAGLRHPSTTPADNLHVPSVVKRLPALVTWTCT